MRPILLHGAAGLWDEILCLLLPATLIWGVAVAVMREGRERAANAQRPTAREERADGSEEEQMAKSPHPDDSEK